MSRLRMIIGDVTIDAEVSDTPTGRAIVEAAPFESVASTWGDEVYFATPVSVPREPDARDVVEPGELALESPADAVRVLDERGQHELDDRGRGAFGQSFELSLDGAGDPQLVRVDGAGHFGVNRARSSSPVM